MKTIILLLFTLNIGYSQTDTDVAFMLFNQQNLSVDQLTQAIEGDPANDMLYTDLAVYSIQYGITDQHFIGGLLRRINTHNIEDGFTALLDLFATNKRIRIDDVYRSLGKAEFLNMMEIAAINKTSSTASQQELLELINKLRNQ